MSYTGFSSVISHLTRSIGLRILIVEDHADCAESLASVLHLFGHEVEIAVDGPSALAAIGAYQPDVVLLDIGLPGMNGYEVAKQLSRPRSVLAPLLIAITGYGSESERSRSSESGIHLHMVKPVDLAHLKAVLKRFQKMLTGLAPE